MTVTTSGGAYIQDLLGTFLEQSELMPGLQIYIIFGSILISEVRELISWYRH